MKRAASGLRLLHGIGLSTDALMTQRAPALGEPTASRLEVHSSSTKAFSPSYAQTAAPRKRVAIIGAGAGGISTFAGQYTTGVDLQETALFSAMQVAASLSPESASLNTLRARLSQAGQGAVSYAL
jgi:hypothetical protein